MASLLMLPTSEIEEFGRIAAFWIWSSSQIGEVSRNNFVFKLAGKQIDRYIDRQRQVELPLPRTDDDDNDNDDNDYYFD